MVDGKWLMANGAWCNWKIVDGFRKLTPTEENKGERHVRTQGLRNTSHTVRNFTGYSGNCVETPTTRQQEGDGALWWSFDTAAYAAHEVSHSL
jgi:hypothetical protein